MGTAGVLGGFQATAMALAVLLPTETTQRTPIPSFGLVSFERDALRSRRREREETRAMIYDYVNEGLVKQGDVASEIDIWRLNVCNRAKERKK